MNPKLFPLPKLKLIRNDNVPSEDTGIELGGLSLGHFLVDGVNHLLPLILRDFERLFFQMGAPLTFQISNKEILLTQFGWDFYGNAFC